MTTLMRNGRDRRSGKPVKCHARKERALLVGTRSANHIRAGGHSGCTQRPDTWLHPNASRKRQIPLASRAPSIHGTFETSADVRYGRFRGYSGHQPTTGQSRFMSTRASTSRFESTAASAMDSSPGSKRPRSGCTITCLRSHSPTSWPESSGAFSPVAGASDPRLWG
jgi:hypothetical protein